MDETFQDLLDKRKRTAVAIFHRFRLEVAKGLRSALFVEGFADKMFYANFLPAGEFDHSSIRISFGKKNMDRIVELFYAEGLDERCVAAFIRDADFDDFLGNLPAGAAVKVLDRYSVENYVFTSDCLRRLFMDRFALEPDEFDIDGCVGRYEDGVQAVFTHLAPLIGAALATIQNGGSLDLDRLDIREIAAGYFVNGDLRALTDDDFSSCKIPPEHRNDESSELGLAYVQRDAFLWIRGHYLAEICCLYTQQQVNQVRAMRQAGQIHTVNPAISSDFSCAALFERMSPLCPRPALIESLAA